MNLYVYFRTQLSDQNAVAERLDQVRSLLGERQAVTVQALRRIDEAKPYLTWMLVASGLTGDRVDPIVAELQALAHSSGLSALMRTPLQIERFETLTA